MESTFHDEHRTIIDKTAGESCLICLQASLEQLFTRLTNLFQSNGQVILTEAFKATPETQKIRCVGKSYPICEMRFRPLYNGESD